MEGEGETFFRKFPLPPPPPSPSKIFALIESLLPSFPVEVWQAFPHRVLKTLKAGLRHPKAKIRFPPPKLLCFGGVCVFMGTLFLETNPAKRMPDVLRDAAMVWKRFSGSEHCGGPEEIGGNLPQGTAKP
ncbi:hypothetical protein WCP94_001507 [Bilophila wadsworthia]